MIRRVLMTADTVGGVWTYSLDLARALGNFDVEVALATMGRRMSPDQAAEAATIPNLEVFESEYRLEWMEDPWGDVKRAGRWLLSLQDAVDPDIVHLNGYCHAALRWSVPTVVVCHSCVLSWWEAVRGEAAPREWDRYAAEVRKGLAAAHLVLAPTQAMLRDANRLHGPFRGSRVVSNACDEQRFAPQEKEPFVFSAGRLWDDAKNVRALQEVAPELDWPVVLAGEGAGQLGQLSKAQMADYLGRAAIYAMPARYEPFGLSILEAAHAGCALVLGDIPSLRENWDGCAVFVNPEHRGALRDAIQDLIRDPQRRQALADAARDRARAFGMDRFAAATFDAYREAQNAAKVWALPEGRFRLA